MTAAINLLEKHFFNTSWLKLSRISNIYRTGSKQLELESFAWGFRGREGRQARTGTRVVVDDRVQSVEAADSIDVPLMMVKILPANVNNEGVIAARKKLFRCETTPATTPHEYTYLADSLVVRVS